MQVKINSYITTSDLTEEQAIEQATSMVDAYDTINENRLGEVVTKLYYIVPTLGKILVVVSEEDKTILGVESNILANTDISDYPLERLPSNVIDYKELIVKVGSSLTTEQIFNAGQSIVEETASKSMPYKIPVLKVINYNNTDVDALVMPSIFGSNIFSSIGGIVNGGDARKGAVYFSGANFTGKESDKIIVGQSLERQSLSIGAVFNSVQKDNGGAIMNICNAESGAWMAINLDAIGIIDEDGYLYGKFYNYSLADDKDHKILVNYDYDSNNVEIIIDGVVDYNSSEKGKEIGLDVYGEANCRLGFQSTRYPHNFIGNISDFSISKIS